MRDLNNYVGKWNTSWIRDKKGEEFNPNQILGSAVNSYGSKLILNEDGTFEDYIEPIYPEEKSVKGTWSVEDEDLTTLECDIKLHYDNDTTKTIQMMYIDGVLTAVVEYGEEYILYLEL